MYATLLSRSESIKLACSDSIHLDLSKFKDIITYNDILLISKIENVKYLRLWGVNRLTEEEWGYLKNMNKLKKLGGYYDLTDFDLKCISEMSQLKKLDLKHCSNITDFGLNYISNMKQLTHLKLGPCNNITDEGLKKLQCMKNLIELNLINCSYITNEGMKYIPENVTKLNLSYTNISSEGLRYLNKLSFLKLKFCDRIRGKDLCI